MKVNVLLFTQTMHSLLASSLPLQGALSVCDEIMPGKAEKNLIAGILKDVNEGKRLADALREHKNIFSPLYTSLIAIGESSGTLTEVFARLSAYIKEKKMLRQKMIQALAYPVLVLATAVAVIFVLLLFVMPRLEGIFTAFTESSENVGLQLARMQENFRASAFILLFAVAAVLLLALLRRLDDNVALALDKAALRAPLIRKAVMTMQMYDFSFAMRLLAATGFPVVPSLMQAKEVLSNRRIKAAVVSVCEAISGGESVGEAFEDEGLFPKYITVWIKIAERNGNTTEAFGQICDYYSAENENILTGITSFAEPVFILITGAIIITVIGQFVLPVFRLLGAL